jgi:hypothetical protein
MVQHASRRFSHTSSSFSSVIFIDLTLKDITIRDGPLSIIAPPPGFFSHEMNAKVQSMQTNRVNVILPIISSFVICGYGYFSQNYVLMIPFTTVQKIWDKNRP